MSYEEYYDPELEFESMDSGRESLEKAVVGRKIIKVEKVEVPSEYGRTYETKFTLDNGREAFLCDTYDCCAFTKVEKFSWLEDVDHVITSVKASEDFEEWFIYADSIPVVELEVGWSTGNPYYYGFGFGVRVEEPN